LAFFAAYSRRQPAILAEKTGVFCVNRLEIFYSFFRERLKFFEVFSGPTPQTLKIPVSSPKNELARFMHNKTADSRQQSAVSVRNS